MAVIPSLEANPCGRATALRGIRDKLITGGGVLEVEQEAGHGGRRRTRFAAANLEALDRAIAEAETACSLSGGGKPRRFAIGGRLS